MGIRLTRREEMALALGAPAPAAWRAVSPPRPARAWLAWIGAAAVLPALAALNLFAVSIDRPVAVVFPAAMSAEASLAAVIAAGGLPLRRGESALLRGAVWIAQADDPDFFAAVRALGAWAVVNPTAFAGCLIVAARAGPARG